MNDRERVGYREKPEIKHVEKPLEMHQRVLLIDIYILVLRDTEKRCEDL